MSKKGNVTEDDSKSQKDSLKRTGSKRERSPVRKTVKVGKKPVFKAHKFVESRVRDEIIEVTKKINIIYF